MLKTDSKHTTVSTDENTFSSIAQTWFKLVPQKDITVNELASVLGLLQISINKSVYDGIRNPEVARHFQELKE